MPATSQASRKHIASRSSLPHTNKQRSISSSQEGKPCAKKAMYETSIETLQPPAEKQAKPPIDTQNQAAADRNRSELLQKYNELRDVGQQLIGMIAEHRGVPIGSLYDSGEFGVGPKD